MAKVTRGDVSTFILPDSVTEEVLRGVAEASLIRQFARERTLTAQRTTISEAEVSGANVYWVGEGQRKPTDAPNMQSLKWTIDAAEMAVIIPMDENVQEDANLDLFGLYTPAIQTAVANKLDNATIWGVDTPLGWGSAQDIVSQINLAGHEFFEDASPTDLELINMIAGTGADDGALEVVEDSGFDPNWFLSDIGFKARLRGLKDADNRYLFGDAVSAGVPSSLFGVPLVFTTVAEGVWNTALAHMLVGDFQQAMVGIKQELRFKTFDQGVITDGAGNVVYSLMESDMVALRVTARFGFKVFADDTADGQTITSASDYPFALVGPEQ